MIFFSSTHVPIGSTNRAPIDGGFKQWHDPNLLLPNKTLASCVLEFPSNLLSPSLSDCAPCCPMLCRVLFSTSKINNDKVYPLGIPTVFAVLLHRKRRLINPPRELRPDALAWWGDHTRSSREPDPRLQDRRIAQTAVLWRVSYRRGGVSRGSELFSLLIL